MAASSLTPGSVRFDQFQLDLSTGNYCVPDSLSISKTNLFKSCDFSSKPRERL